MTPMCTVCGKAIEDYVEQGWEEGRSGEEREARTAGSAAATVRV